MAKGHSSGQNRVVVLTLNRFVVTLPCLGDTVNFGKKFSVIVLYLLDAALLKEPLLLVVYLVKVDGLRAQTPSDVPNSLGVRHQRFMGELLVQDWVAVTSLLSNHL